jgi:signal transduction histidine kinase
MKFSTKLFLALFLTSTLTVAAGCVFIYKILSHYRTAEFEDSYIDHMNLLSLAMQRLQQAGSPHPEQMLGDLAGLDVDNKKVELLTATMNDARPDGAYWQDKTMQVIVTTPVGRLRSTISTDTYDRERNRILEVCVILSLSLAVISFFLSRMLTQTLLRKIRGIQDVVGEVTEQKDYSRRIPVSLPSEDELELLSDKFNNMFATIESNQKVMIAAATDKARAEVAAQVAHDIRSPLTSLTLGLNEIEKHLSSESLHMIKNSLGRISGTLQKISKSSVQDENVVETPKLTLLHPLLENIIAEQQIRLPAGNSLSLESSQRNIWCVIQVNEIQTAISNLINNAFEAKATKVSLKVSIENKKISIELQDNGSGIPSEHVDKVFDRHFTHGKSGGSGLGLDQAKAAFAWSDGSIELKSTSSTGTCFLLTLPQEKAPAYIADHLELSKEQDIFVVDDDTAILKIWEGKIPSSKRMTTPDELKKTPPAEKDILIIDNHLRQSKTGLEVITEGHPNATYLCTADYDDPAVQTQVKKLKIKLIPKPLLADFRIERLP